MVLVLRPLSEGAVLSGRRWPSDRLRKCLDARPRWHWRTGDVVVKLMLPVRNNETETAAWEASCAVHSEAVVKFGKRLGCDRCRRQPPAAWQSWPWSQASGTWSDEDEMQIAPMRSHKIARRHSSASLFPVSTATRRRSDKINCEATQLRSHVVSSCRHAGPASFPRFGAGRGNERCRPQQREHQCVGCRHESRLRTCQAAGPGFSPFHCSWVCDTRAGHGVDTWWRLRDARANTASGTHTRAALWPGFRAPLKFRTQHPLPRSGVQNFGARVCVLVAWGELTTGRRRWTRRSDGHPLMIAQAAHEKEASPIGVQNPGLTIV